MCGILRSLRFLAERWESGRDGERGNAEGKEKGNDRRRIGRGGEKEKERRRGRGGKEKGDTCKGEIKSRREKEREDKQAFI